MKDGAIRPDQVVGHEFGHPETEAYQQQTADSIYAYFEQRHRRARRRRAGRPAQPLPARRGRRGPPHPRGDPRHLLPLPDRRARHGHRIAGLLLRLPRRAPRRPAQDRRGARRDPGDGRGDAALGDAGDGCARVATRDTEIDGFAISEGEHVMALLGAANVDGAEFPHGRRARSGTARSTATWRSVAASTGASDRTSRDSSSASRCGSGTAASPTTASSPACELELHRRDPDPRQLPDASRSGRPEPQADASGDPELVADPEDLVEDRVRDRVRLGRGDARRGARRCPRPSGRSPGSATHPSPSPTKTRAKRPAQAEKLWWVSSQARLARYTTMGTTSSGSMAWRNPGSSSRSSRSPTVSNTIRE